ncbi:bacillithiol biosynthesis deacetylase BshB1 [Kaistella anthropi]|nr:bacillithiol biosynthesis deacetylase BshB1 [Kaistella anthropi]
MVDLTQGELGTRGTNFTRAEEAAEAAKILGISARENLKMKDGFIQNSEEYQMKIVTMIRKYQPEIVLSNAIDDRHPDHAKASKLVSDACFLSGLVKIETVLEGNNQQAWRPKHIFNYIQWKNITPDFVIDITDFMQKKLILVWHTKHSFTIQIPRNQLLPLQRRIFWKVLLTRAQDLGRLSGVEFAEGFTTEKLIALKNFDGIIL